MAYVGQPTVCGHEDRHPIPGTDLEAVRTCGLAADRPWDQHEHHYGNFMLRTIEGVPADE